MSSSREEYIDQSDAQIFEDLCLYCLSQYLTKQVDLLRQMNDQHAKVYEQLDLATRPGEKQPEAGAGEPYSPAPDPEVRTRPDHATALSSDVLEHASI